MQQNSKNVQFKRWWKYKYHKKYSIYNKPNNLGSEWVILYPMMLCWTRPVKDESMCLSSRENDVAAIDVNMGCPKEYSTKVSLLSVTYQLLRPLADLLLTSDWPLNSCRAGWEPLFSLTLTRSRRWVLQSDNKTNYKSCRRSADMLGAQVLFYFIFLM